MRRDLRLTTWLGNVLPAKVKPKQPAQNQTIIPMIQGRGYLHWADHHVALRSEVQAMQLLQIRGMLGECQQVQRKRGVRTNLCPDSKSFGEHKRDDAMVLTRTFTMSRIINAFLYSQTIATMAHTILALVAKLWIVV